jgi:heptosyltransferase III
MSVARFSDGQRQPVQKQIQVQRILVIRGGAIGDFILTLPALRLLRDNYPNAHIEILGYKHIIALAEDRFYANATRSIDYAPLSRFFARDAELAADLVAYFGGFDLIVSYLFDPDETFAENLKRCGVPRLITGSPKFSDREHAAVQLAAPLMQLGLRLIDPVAKLFPNEADRKAAAEFLAAAGDEVVAIHPGSGSEKKNWAIENWIELGNALLNRKPLRSGAFPSAQSSSRRSGKRRSLLIVSGEAEEKQARRLLKEWKNNSAVRLATNLPLPLLAAVLEKALFVGHDSGISHLAAAAGAKCILLFGPTDPAIWAPANPSVKVLRAPNGAMERIEPIKIQETLADLLSFRAKSRNLSLF